MQPFGERHAFQAFHHQIIDRLAAARRACRVELVERTEIRMGQAGDGPCLDIEA
jgi:hypothetical protein